MHTRIRVLRKALNMTQTEFGESLGVSRAVIATYELGKVVPPASVLKLLTVHHNVNPKWLETGELPMFLPMDEEDKLHEFVDRVCAMDSDSFKKRMFNALANLSESGWEALEAFLTEYEKANRKEQ